VKPDDSTSTGAIASAMKAFSARFDAFNSGVATYSKNNYVSCYARNAYFDTKLSRAILYDNFKQIVIIGAQYDTRVYHFGQSDHNIQFFEIDLPDAIDHILEVVSTLNIPKDQVEYIGADLETTPVKQILENNEKFVQAKPTLYLLNGLTYHLPQATVDSLFNSLGEVAAPGSVLAYDFANKCLFDQSCEKSKKFQSFLRATKIYHEPWVSGMEPVLQEQWLAQNGFDLRELITFHDADDGSIIDKKKMKGTAALMSQMNFVMAVKNEEEIVHVELEAEQEELILLDTISLEEAEEVAAVTSDEEKKEVELDETDLMLLQDEDVFQMFQLGMGSRNSNNMWYY
jgi:methyltransferase (TIGR00027 family)